MHLNMLIPFILFTFFILTSLIKTYNFFSIKKALINSVFFKASLAILFWIFLILGLEFYFFVVPLLLTGYLIYSFFKYNKVIFVLRLSYVVIF